MQQQCGLGVFAPEAPSHLQAFMPPPGLQPTLPAVYLGEELMNVPFATHGGLSDAFAALVKPALQPDQNSPSWAKDALVKRRPSIQSDKSTADSENATTECIPSNPGSLGHPNLCSRACHYFAAGSCANGESCQFCHLPHCKRPIRLDKANRSRLRNMSFEERAAIVMPIMKKKALTIGLSMEPLMTLETLIDQEYPGFHFAQPMSAQAKANVKVFRDVLKSRSLASFVKLLTEGVRLSPVLLAALDAVDAQMQQY